MDPSNEDDREWSATELRNALRSIEWDLEDLDDTVQIVEKNPAKFRIDASELAVRKNFIAHTKTEVVAMKEAMTSNQPPMEAVSLNDDDVEIVIDNERDQKKLLLRNQDDQLEAMSTSVGNIRDMSYGIGNELDEQAVMLDEFGAEMEHAETKLDATIRKMSKVLRMSNNDRRQWIAIGALSSFAFVLLVLLFAF